MVSYISKIVCLAFILAACSSPVDEAVKVEEALIEKAVAETTTVPVTVAEKLPEATPAETEVVEVKGINWELFDSPQDFQTQLINTFDSPQDLADNLLIDLDFRTDFAESVASYVYREIPEFESHSPNYAQELESVYALPVYAVSLSFMGEGFVDSPSYLEGILDGVTDSLLLDGVNPFEPEEDIDVLLERVETAAEEQATAIEEIPFKIDSPNSFRGNFLINFTDQQELSEALVLNTNNFRFTLADELASYMVDTIPDVDALSTSNKEAFRVALADRYETILSEPANISEMVGEFGPNFEGAPQWLEVLTIVTTDTLDVLDPVVE